MNTLAQITREHECLLELAKHIEAKLKQYEGQPDPDYPQLLEWVEQLRHTFIHDHQSKETLLFDHVLSDTGNAQPLLDTFIHSEGLLFQHALDRLACDLGALLHDQVISRQQILSRGHQMLHHLRNQIASEEAATLPWAKAQLDAADWAKIKAQTQNRTPGCLLQENGHR